MKIPLYWIDKFNSEAMIKEIQKDAYNSALKDVQNAIFAIHLKEENNPKHAIAEAIYELFK